VKKAPVAAEFLSFDLAEVVSLPVTDAGRVGVAPYDRFAGYKLRGLWFKRDSYGKLRNSAWLLRNSRVGRMYNPAALAVCVSEGKALIGAGEDLGDVLEAFAELLIHP
jgi:hypothetical protein